MIRSVSFPSRRGGRAGPSGCPDLARVPAPSAARRRRSWVAASASPRLVAASARWRRAGRCCGRPAFCSAKPALRPSRVERELLLAADLIVLGGELLDLAPTPPSPWASDSGDERRPAGRTCPSRTWIGGSRRRCGIDPGGCRYRRRGRPGLGAARILAEDEDGGERGGEGDHQGDVEPRPRRRRGDHRPRELSRPALRSLPDGRAVLSSGRLSASLLDQRPLAEMAEKSVKRGSTVTCLPSSRLFPSFPRKRESMRPLDPARTPYGPQPSLG